MSVRWFEILRSVAAPLMLLTGCVMSAPMPRPADFPFHVAAPPIDIHWRLSLQGDVARADGLIERRQPYVARAWLQLLGLDAAGRIVSFTTPTWVRWFGWDSEPFTIRLRPRGDGTAVRGAPLLVRVRGGGQPVGRRSTA